MQAVVLFLKKQNLTYREISYLINRDERNIWSIYNKAVKKLKKEKQFIEEKHKQTKIKLPLHIFHNKQLTPVEAIISFLKDYHNLTYHKISLLINRDERNVWKIYNNSLKKSNKTKTKENKNKTTRIAKVKEKIEINPKLLTLMSAIEIPTHIFYNKSLTPMQAIVFYLKKQDLTYRQISYLINRNERNIWTIYNQAKKKLNKNKITKINANNNKLTKEKFFTKIKLPLHIFHNKTLTPMEAVISFLKDYHNLTYHEISIMINRDERNIWTIYNNAKKKSNLKTMNQNIGEKKKRTKYR